MKDIWHPFKKEVISTSKIKAKEKVFSIIGSNHRVKRRMVKIEELDEITSEEVENPVVKYLIEH